MLLSILLHHASSSKQLCTNLHKHQLQWKCSAYLLLQAICHAAIISSLLYYYCKVNKQWFVCSSLRSTSSNELIGRFCSVARDCQEEKAADPEY